MFAPIKSRPVPPMCPKHFSSSSSLCAAKAK